MNKLVTNKMNIPIRLNCTGKIFTPVADGPVMWIMALVMPLIFIFGITGNILSFIILKDSSTKVSSFFYIRCLTIFDSLSLFFTMFGFYGALVIHPMLIEYEPYQKISYIWVLWGTCQLRTYLAFTSRTLAIWTIVIFTVERFVCIKFPLWSIKLCTIRNAKIIIGVLVAIAMTCNISWIFSFKKYDCGRVGISICKSRNSMLTFRILDMLMLSVIPALIIILCNITIIVTLKQRRRLSMVAYEDSLNKNRDLKITLQLLVVSSTFTLLTIPQCISVILNTYHEWYKHTDYRSGDLANFYHISFLLFTLNFAINFILYCFIGDNFRNAALNILLCQLEQMRSLRKAIFETQSNETKNSTVSRSQSKKNSVINPNTNVKLNQFQREKDPLVGETLC